MIKSMTGYGKGEGIAGNKKITVEIRSLNSKQLDLTLKSPQIYRCWEYDIRNKIAKAMQRGKTDVSIFYETKAEATSATINKEAFGAYFRQLSQIAAENGLDWGKDPAGTITATVLKLPEVIHSETSAIDEEEVLVLNKCVDMALEAIDEFRQQEGAILIADLTERINKIERLKNSVTPYEKARTETVRNRIRENIASLGIQPDNNRLEQEMIFYVEKLDITEEKVRLQNHCDYFRQVAVEEDGAGRKLGFIAQEIGREINTMGSKANEANIQKIVVDMKDELEKIKEQLLNIL